MKIVVFGPDRRVGLWQGDRVIDVNKAVATHLGADKAARAPANLLAYIEAGQEALDLTRAAAEKAGDDPSVSQPYAGTKIWAPWPGRRVACAGANNPQHILNNLLNTGKEGTVEGVRTMLRKGAPSGFFKVPVEVAGPGDDITYPARSTRFDYEAELAVIVGKRGKDIPKGKARDYVWGLTLANDWSDRDQLVAQPFPISLNLMKNFDDCLTLGPCILVEDGLDPDAVDGIRLTLNGQERQNFSNRDSIFSFCEFVEYLTRDLSIVPGDVILTGTGPGTAVDTSKWDGDRPLPDLFIKPGDVLEVSAPNIGSFQNKVVAKA